MELAPPDTLIVRRLSEALTESDLNELFQNFGAHSAKRQYLRGKKKRSNVLVKFPSHEEATLALIRLHQLAIMGKRLIVEYANFTFLPPPKPVASHIDNTSSNTWGYKPVNESIARNVASQLLKNEQFYLRVLQLMKLMGLKPPFIDEPPTKTPIDMSEIFEAPIEDIEMEELYKEETEESELESDGDVADKKDSPVPELLKREKKLKLKKLDRLKTAKATKLAVQTSSKKEKAQKTLSDIFEQPKELTSDRKLQFKIATEKTDTEPVGVATSTALVEGFGLFKPPVAISENPELVEEPVASTSATNDFISEHTLLANRLNDEERKSLPVFKGYSPGVPNSRLYIKNIAKGVKEEDLKYVFGRYVHWESEEERNMFDIRLMTEGRMKGQAFITLPSVQQAEKALAETNGYVLQSKPFVVQFARAAVSKESSNIT